MEVTDIIAANFGRLPYPTSGVLILLLLALVSLFVSWQRKLWMANGVLWLAIAIILGSAIKEEFELGRGDGFGRLFLVFHGFVLFIYGLVVSVTGWALSLHNRPPHPGGVEDRRAAE